MGEKGFEVSHGVDAGADPEFKGQEPTLEEQTAVYAEMFGMKAGEILEPAKELQAEMTEQERREFTSLIYVPEGETSAQAWERVENQNPTFQDIDPSQIKTVDNNPEPTPALVAFARSSQEPDPDSLGEQAKSAEDWEKEDTKLMTPRMGLIVREAFRQLTGRQMDSRNATMFPGFRSGGGLVPNVSFSPGFGGVYLYDRWPGDRGPGLGVRQVVKKELKT